MTECVKEMGKTREERERDQKSTEEQKRTETMKEKYINDSLGCNGFIDLA